MKEFNILKHALIPAIATIVLAVAMYYSFVPPAYPVDYAIITAILFIMIVLIVILFYGKKHPDKIKNAGNSDMAVQDQIEGRD
ncbi:MAG: hypothetical protein QXZ44_07285 [Ferroplasma sp.]